MQKTGGIDARVAFFRPLPSEKFLRVTRNNAFHEWARAFPRRGTRRTAGEGRGPEKTRSHPRPGRGDGEPEERPGAAGGPAPGRLSHPSPGGKWASGVSPESSISRRPVFMIRHSSQICMSLRHPLARPRAERSSPLWTTPWRRAATWERSWANASGSPVSPSAAS